MSCGILLIVPVFPTLYPSSCHSLATSPRDPCCGSGLPSGVTGKLFLARSYVRTWGNLPNKNTLHTLWLRAEGVSVSIQNVL